jgi:hypothetical protein
MASFQTNPYGLDELLPMLDRAQVVLPEFQRSFVWRPGDIDLLLTSLVQGFPSGSLLFLRADASLELAWRPVEGAPAAKDGTPHYLVLDGQQRLTSLSLALNGRGDHVFFMDLTLCSADDLDNGIYAIRRTRAKQRGLFERERQFELHTYPLWAVVGEGTDDYWFEDYAQFHADRGASDVKELRAKARDLKEQFVDPLKKYEFPVVVLPPDTSLEAVCQIFETLNKTGMKLTVFDLMTAKFWPQGLNLRDMHERARSEYALLGEDEFDVEPVFLLQAIALLRSGLCKKGDLLKLDVENFEEEWWRVCGAASAALGVLRSECGVLTRDWLPYVSLFPALFAVTTKIQTLKGAEVGAAWDKVMRWFWCSNVGQRYEGPQNTLNATDARQVWAWIEDENQVPEAVENFSLADLDLGRVERQRNAVYRSVICLTIVNGARDFHTGNRLTADFLRDPQRKIEDHHIFATGYLRKKMSRSGENSVVNRCLIDNVTNRIIADKAPSEYLKEIEDKLGLERLEDLLASHLIPTRGSGAPWTDDVEAFLTARKQLVLKAIASVTGAVLPELGGVEAYLDPARPFTNELALRKVIRGLRGRLFWYEQHMTRKNLEPLIEEVQGGLVTEVRLLSGPAHISEKLKRSYEAFATEMKGKGVMTDWRILPDKVARDMHARVLFDDASTWELPPLNSLYKGTVDSIHSSSIPRTRFEEAWSSPDATPIGAFDPPPPKPVDMASSFALRQLEPSDEAVVVSQQSDEPERLGNAPSLAEARESRELPRSESFDTSELGDQPSQTSRGKRAVFLARLEEEARASGEFAAIEATPENVVMLRDERGLRWERVAVRVFGDPKMRSAVQDLYDQAKGEGASRRRWGAKRAASYAEVEEEARAAGEFAAFEPTLNNVVMLRDKRNLRWERVAVRVFGEPRRVADVRRLYDEAKGEGASTRSYVRRGRNAATDESSGDRA